MNMFYTGLGIARSLGEEGIPVIGLSSHGGVYGEYTRYAKVVACPDSRNDPEGLLAFLQKMGEEHGRPLIIFPTRDEDVLFLDQCRDQLAPFFHPVVPEGLVVQACLDKWETYRSAQRAGVAVPRSWLIEGERDLLRAIAEATFPCVLKPVASYHWRMGGNWKKVGGRKVLGVASREELLAEYAAIARAEQRAVLQEMIPGGDDCLVITGCYADRQSRLAAFFNTKKLVQVPEGFGTGVVVQAADYPELIEPTGRLLKAMRFTGIAEVEYKWDSARREYKLIEINARPWDQHRLGIGCGVNLPYIAYCDHAGLPMPPQKKRASAQKWIAEDSFFIAVLAVLARGNFSKARILLRMARGKRCYAIWALKDPLPFFAYGIRLYFPELARAGVRAIWSRFQRQISGNAFAKDQSAHIDGISKRGKSHG
jgi:predicted ATP-grasp superfamily ATP-dependent carboligase